MRLHPALMVSQGFLTAIIIGTILLMMPFATPKGQPPANVLDALFTATSATCLTGLVTVDTQTYWSTGGQVIIMLLIQLGGLGIMTMASVLALIFAGRMGIRTRLTAAAEGRGADLGEIRWVVRATLLFTLVTELIVAVFLTVRFHVGYGYGWGRAAWEGAFHAVSGFNNAGFALYTDNVMDFVSDAWILLPLAFALMVGGIGFPVLLEIFRASRARARAVVRRRRHVGHRFSLTTRFTLIGTGVLVAAGFVLVALGEWNGAMRGLDGPEKVLNAFFAGVSPRTAGFNALDYGAFHPSTLLGTDILMMIGGGSGGTAGGVKVTTAAVLIAAVYAEIRGDSSISVFGRRLAPRVMRQALAVATFGLVLVVGAVTAILFIAPQFSTDRVVFEVVSAFATVGLSTGITGDLPAAAQVILIVLMFLGRVGPLSLASGLAARHRDRMYDYPEERPFIG
ncbi:TrkH family potassium uptake protein [Corynebacterium sp. 335C]